MSADRLAVGCEARYVGPPIRTYRGSVIRKPGDPIGVVLTLTDRHVECTVGNLPGSPGVYPRASVEPLTHNQPSNQENQQR